MPKKGSLTHHFGGVFDVVDPRKSVLGRRKGEDGLKRNVKLELAHAERDVGHDEAVA